MKKLIAIIVLLVYGFSSSGMTLHFHYCCGQLDKVDFSPAKFDKCGAATKVISKWCCNDQQVDLKIKTDHNLQPFIQSSFQSDKISILYFDAVTAITTSTKKLLPAVFISPPLKKDFASLFSTYRI